MMDNRYFDRLDRLGGIAADSVMGGTFRLTPQRRGDNPNRISPDADRITVVGIGILDRIPAPSNVALGNRPLCKATNALRTLISGDDWVLSVDRQRHFATVGSEPRPGDLVEFPSQSGLPTFRVYSVERDGTSRIELKLHVLNKNSDT